MRDLSILIAFEGPSQERLSDRAKVFSGLKLVLHAARDLCAAAGFEPGLTGTQDTSIDAMFAANVDQIRDRTERSCEGPTAMAYKEQRISALWMAGDIPGAVAAVDDIRPKLADPSDYEVLRDFLTQLQATLDELNIERPTF